MRILVCGGRDFDDWAMLCAWLDLALAHFGPFVVVEGEAIGADFLARVWAKWRGLDYLPFPADWKQHGYRAGPIRNQQMLDEGAPDVVIAFPGGTGTADMVARSRAKGLPVYIAESFPRA